MTEVFPVLEGKIATITGAAMGRGEATARVYDLNCSESGAGVGKWV